MCRINVLSLGLGALAIALGRPAASQLPGFVVATPGVSKSEASSPNVLWPVHSLTAADRVRLDATIRRADTLVLQGKLAEASHMYWSVVSEQNAAEDYPVITLRRLADMYFGAGDAYSAATVLMELADSATEFGDPTTRLESLFDASLAYREVGRADRVLECVRQMRPLLKSAAIPEAVRAEIQRRIVVRRIKEN